MAKAAPNEHLPDAPPLPTKAAYEPKPAKQKTTPDPFVSAISTTATVAHPNQFYVRLKPLPSTTMTALDPTSVRLSLLNSLSAYLGDHGAAVPVDVLSVEDGPDVPVHDRGVVVRVPYENGVAFCAAVAAVGGMRVDRRAEWLDGVAASVPKGLFELEAG